MDRDFSIERQLEEILKINKQRVVVDELID